MDGPGEVGGGHRPGGLEQITGEDFDRIFEVNVKGTLLTVQKTLPLLNDGASVILNASTARRPRHTGVRRVRGLQGRCPALCTDLGQQVDGGENQI